MRRWDTPGDIPLDWAAFMAKKRAELVRLHGIYTNLLKNSGCDMIEGRATVVDPHTVEVAGKRYTVRSVPPLCPLDHWHRKLIQLFHGLYDSVFSIVMQCLQKESQFQILAI